MQEALKVLDLLAAGKIGNQDPRVEEALREAVAFCRQQTDEGNLRAQLSAAQAQWENEHRLWNEADTKLSAAQAEIERRQSVQLHDAMLHGQTLLALQAAQAETARLDRKHRFWSEAADVLETKLTNLRAAAEHAAVELETSGTSMRDSRLAARIRSVLEAS